MADVFTKSKRSEVMARIRSRGNKATELALARIFRAQRITGWRRQQQIRITNDQIRDATARAGFRASSFEFRRFRVTPDFVFLKPRVAVFVDGCFWHGCPKHCNPRKWLRKSSMPGQPAAASGGRTGRVFWQAKLVANVARDRRVNRALRRAGWRVLRIWEHELAKQNTPRLLRRLQQALT